MREKTGRTLSARHRRPTTSTVPSRRSSRATPAKRITTDDDLWAILNRKSPLNAKTRRCACADCAAVRAAPFTCSGCGYEDEPTVMPCDCSSRWKGDVAYLSKVLTDKARDEQGRQYATRRLAELRAAGRSAMCPVADSSYCAHGEAVCPVCNDSGCGMAFEHNSGTSEAAAIIRDLRAALRARATA